jgi:hypothetical protein
MLLCFSVSPGLADSVPLVSILRKDKRRPSGLRVRVFGTNGPFGRAPPSAVSPRNGVHILIDAEKLEMSDELKGANIDSSLLLSRENVGF